MTRIIEANELNLGSLLTRRDSIVVGQACGEPTRLVEVLIAQSPEIDDLSVFIGSSFSGLIDAESARTFALRGIGGIGTLRAASAAGRLTIIPIRMSEIEPAIAEGSLRCDVAMISVGPADSEGFHSCGLVSDHIRAAIAKARLVVAEINECLPWTFGERIHSSEIDVAVPVNYSPPEIAPTRTDAVSRAIAKNCAASIDDGSVLQSGVGALPDAIIRQLGDRKDLGVHSGMIGDGFVDLIEAGVVTNARKEIDAGISVGCALVGTSRLYRFAHRNPAMRMAPASYTHGAAVIARLTRFVAINSALEVDLTGQVNCEVIDGQYIGATGGVADFARAASNSPGGRNIITLPATARQGSVSRIVARLSGPVTLSRSDADVIVTEFGAAELKGCSLSERARRLVAIAHPDFREDLDRTAHAIAVRGF
ncbi:acetyl-CoA hydrolase [Tsuneonella sp. YG55]|uniref:Acetyl-CoA hydrolase n=1 Tax=Tsuneonella litorea TaxID=2976475 RepID=A0A9X2VYP6_9SPHN|nr:acetyl-CoA hydrolase/transferase C-terminal domain-containing protein [Tsuneonella litorea]MCT2557503.1 acetyl-CoA hydrolase [Tsuneonella litorea]